LRAELAELKEKIQERQTELANEPSPLSGTAAADPLGSPYAPTAAAPISARDQSIGVLAIALFSLVIGWVLGSTFGRRGPRSGGRRSGRLRF